MFKALLLALSDGQSFKNVEICEQQDFEKYGIQRLFDDYTSCFFADKKCILLHNWTIKLIHLNKEYVKGGIHSERVILDGNVSFSNITVIENDDLAKYNIPSYFGLVDGNQFTFSCKEGTFITKSFSVASMTIENHRHVGLTKKFNYDNKKIVDAHIQPRISSKKK